jgi:hypothetical protein
MSHRIWNLRRLAIVTLFVGLQASLNPTASLAQSSSNNPTFGSRAANPDGSVALTVGRRLPTEWDTRFGLDATLAPELNNAGVADTVLHGTSTTDSSGTIWGRITGPGAPLFWDKTAVETRLNPAAEQGQFVATMSRTLPLGANATVTLQDKYSVTQSLQGAANELQPNAIASGAATVWEADRSLRLNLAPTGTTLSAGLVTSNADHQWHNRLTAEQQIVGPLSVTTSVTDPATAASSKSIGARFKHTW